MIATGMLFVMRAEIDDLMDCERFPRRAFRLVTPVALSAAEVMKHVGLRIALNCDRAYDFCRSVSQACDFGFELADACAKAFSLADADLCGVHPGIKLIRDGKDIGR